MNRKRATMATKAIKEVKEEYFYAVGRRKTAVAQVRLYPVKSKKEQEAAEVNVTVNEKDFSSYFQTVRLQGMLLAPLRVVGMANQFRVTLVARGGGIAGQADASRLAIARALVKYDVALRPILKASKLLVRDARKVERKKAGLKKARRAPQWSKR